MHQDAFESDKERYKEEKSERKENLAYLGPVKLLANSIQFVEEHVPRKH